MRPNEDIITESTELSMKGRGVTTLPKPSDACNCKRKYTNILCQNCGHLMTGRVKHKCRKHPTITFLIDITNCPVCKSSEFFLSEIES